MGDRRIMGQYEVVFPADDPRTDDELVQALSGAFNDGIQDRGGQMARLAVLSVASDPDPERSGDDVSPDEPPAGTVVGYP
jgi:hypothetical protein